MKHWKVVIVSCQRSPSVSKTDKTSPIRADCSEERGFKEQIGSDLLLKSLMSLSCFCLNMKDCKRSDIRTPKHQATDGRIHLRKICWRKLSLSHLVLYVIFKLRDKLIKYCSSFFFLYLFCVYLNTIFVSTKAHTLT